MSLPIVEVRVLADVQSLKLIDCPHRVILRGVDKVRDALPMLEAITKKFLNLKGVGSSEKQAGVGSSEKQAEEGHGDSASDDDDDDWDSDTSYSDNEDGNSYKQQQQDEEEDPGNGWVLVNIQPLRHVALLAAVLEELLGDILPLLTRNPGSRNILLRLLTNGKEIRRIGIGSVVAGNTGELSVTLGNRVKKLVSHAFNDKRGKPRTRARRAAWIAKRLDSLRLQAKEDHTVILKY